MESPDGSQPPPSAGLKGIFAKARRNKHLDNSSNLSINGTDTNTLENAAMRESTGSLLDKLKSPMRKTNDESDDDGKISNLIPALKKRRQRKREERASLGGGEEPSGRVHTTVGDQDGKSSTTLGTGNESDDSLMTSDSEHETSTVPPLLSHKSHIGYLTSSSPIIKTTTNPEHAPARASTFAASDNTSNIRIVATRHASTTGPLTAGSTLSIDSAGSGKSSSRSVSPGSKLKEAFKPSAKKIGTTAGGSPERGGNAINALFSKDRRGSMSSRRAGKGGDDVPPMPSPINFNTINNSSDKSLPFITPITNPAPDGLLEAPETRVTPPTPVDPKDTSKNSRLFEVDSPSPASPVNNSTTSPSGIVISHRKSRSDSAGGRQPSKLSQAMSVPMTPLEEKPPGSRNVSMNKDSTSGFFSSVFNAAQNAATSFTSTMGNNPSRPRSNTALSGEDDDSASSTVPGAAGETKTLPKEQPKLAIDTIGTGDLSLSHLGISADNLSANSNSPTSINDQPERGRSGTVVRRDEAAARAEDVSAARAVSAAYGEKSQDNNATTPVAEDAAPMLGRSSTYAQSITPNGDQTPPNGSVYEGDNSGLWRTGSLRSKVGKGKKRDRNSSGGTGMTIGAAISASHSTIMSPGRNGSTPKITGFAVASKKRNRDYHQLFRSVPEDDYLIDDYSCALQRDIILAGRIYISEGHICFSSNILGWVTTLVMSFDEVVSVEKESTAMVFPNAIAIKTLHARHTFRSLLSREATYDLLIGIWKNSHPSLQSSENGVRLVNGGTGSKTEKVEPVESDSASDASDDEEIYDEDDDQVEDDDQGSVDGAGGSNAGSEKAESPAKSGEIRKPSALGTSPEKPNGSAPAAGEAKAADKPAGSDFPGPATHAPTECADGATHYEKILKDEVIPAPLGKVYSMIFGPASGVFMTQWLLEEIKVLDLQMEPEAKQGLNEESKSRSFSYIKPLNASIGPRQTKCIITEALDAFDLEKAVSITSTTQTPDVPSGSVFSTKTKYCLMWGPNNGTRLLMSCNIEWTGKSWLKGPIEKGANDGQTTYANDLVKVLRAGITTRPRASTTTSKGKKGRKRKGEGEEVSATTTTTKTTVVKPSDWGLFEPLHGIVAPIVDILKPLLNAQSLVGLLLFLLIISWFRNSRSRVSGFGPAKDVYRKSDGLSQRAAAYEEMWRGEEGALWDWLEERVGMGEGGAYSGYGVGGKGWGNQDGSRRAIQERGGVFGGKKLEDVVRGMGEREVRHALETTEEKLEVLRGVVEKINGQEVEHDVTKDKKK